MQAASRAPRIRPLKDKTVGMRASWRAAGMPEAASSQTDTKTTSKGARVKPHLYHRGRWRYEPANFSAADGGMAGLNLAAAAWCAWVNGDHNGRVRVVGL